MNINEIGLKNVHIGEAIDSRRNELSMSKTELARKIGIRQQHINIILDSEKIDTAKLYKLCQVLNFNFFTLYCSNANEDDSFLKSGINQEADINNHLRYENQILSVKLQASYENIDILKQNIEGLKESIKFLENNLKDKDTIIGFYKTTKK